MFWLTLGLEACRRLSYGPLIALTHLADDRVVFEISRRLNCVGPIVKFA
jgi:hypothetical protein